MERKKRNINKNKPIDVLNDVPRVYRDKALVYFYRAIQLAKQSNNKEILDKLQSHNKY